MLLKKRRLRCRQKQSVTAEKCVLRKGPAVCLGGDGGQRADEPKPLDTVTSVHQMRLRDVSAQSFLQGSYSFLRGKFNPFQSKTYKLLVVTLTVFFYYKYLNLC